MASILNLDLTHSRDQGYSGIFFVHRRTLCLLRKAEDRGARAQKAARQDASVHFGHPGGCTGSQLETAVHLGKPQTELGLLVPP